MIFLCENNQYALSTPAHTVTSGVIADRAAGFGMPGVRVENGQDVLGRLRRRRRGRATAPARGEGPTLVEVVTYRFNEHSEGLSSASTTATPTRRREWLAKRPDRAVPRVS